MNSKEIIIDLPYIIDIGLNDEHLIENFYSTENNKIRWTKNSSKVLIKYPSELGALNLTINVGGGRPKDNSANIELYINDKKIGNKTKPSGYFTYSYIVPKKYLNEYYQILEIKTNTWKPSDYGSKDKRDLGVQLDWINIDVADIEIKNIPPPQKT